MPHHQLQPLVLALLISLAGATQAGADAFDEVLVYRPSSSQWFTSHNRGSPNFYRPAGLGPAPVTSSTSWGFANEIPLIGDVNGDNFDDIVILRDVATKNQYLAGHTNTSVVPHQIGSQSFPAADSETGDFGTPTLTEAHFLADMNGDGFDDVLRVTNAASVTPFNWKHRPSTAVGLTFGNASDSAFHQFGLPGDQPIVGDFNGDGLNDVGVYRNGSDILWTGTGAGGVLGDLGQGPFGQIGTATGNEVLHTANLDGDQFDDAIMVLEDGAGLIEWFGLINDGSGLLTFANPGTTTVGFGLDNGVDIPVIADINGDNMDDIGVYRDGTWFFTFTTAGGALGANAGGDEVFAFGLPGDTPLIGEFGAAPPIESDFDGDGDSDGKDFLTWQNGFGIQAPNATQADGDANDDQAVDDADLAIWESEFGTGAGGLAAASGLAVVPEPSSLALIAMAMLTFTGVTSRRRGTAVASS